jgi:hypothetical protein
MRDQNTAKSLFGKEIISCPVFYLSNGLKKNLLTYEALNFIPALIDNKHWSSDSLDREDPLMPISACYFESLFHYFR